MGGGVDRRRQYEISVRYVGHAPTRDRIAVDGDPYERDAALRFLEGGELRAVATVGRDRTCLEAELERERSLLQGGRHAR